MTYPPDPMNSLDEAPNSPRGVPVSFAVVIMVGVSALIISAPIDSDTVYIIGNVLMFSGIFGLGEIRYKRCKYLFYCIAFAATVTGIGGGILVSAFFDWLH